MKKIFGLLTDFGFDFAVASIKGVLLKACPDAQIIDIDHTIEKFNLINAAFVIEKIYRFLPDNIICLCVVDPGVGSQRDILCVELGSQRFIGPNNGIFHYLLQNKESKVYKIPQHIFNSESVTFHGRDIFAPAALKLVRGDTSILTTIERSSIVRLPDLDAQINRGVITYIDSFGNIKTNIVVQETLVPETYVNLVVNGDVRTIKFVRTFVDVLPGQLLCYKGSNATLEIAANCDSARKKLDAKIGAAVSLHAIAGENI